MQTMIYHTVNCGLYFVHQGRGLFVDGIHQGAAEGFSDTPAEVLSQISARTGIWQNLQGLLFTHLHPDHYDSKALTDIINPKPNEVNRTTSTIRPAYENCTTSKIFNDFKTSRNPENRKVPDVYGPSCPYNTIAPASTMNRDLLSFSMAGADILAIRFLHDGEHLRDTELYSYLLRYPEETFFLAGDAEFQKEDAYIINALCPEPITMGFFNIYHYIRPHLIEFMETLRIRRRALYHLPFPEDDRYILRHTAQTILEKVAPDLQPDLLTHMSDVTG